MRQRLFGSLICTLLIFYLPVIALPASASFFDIAVLSAKAPLELRTMVEQLNAGSQEAIARNQFNQNAQTAVLAKAGECIDRAVFFHGRSPAQTEDEQRSIFQINREVIKRILDLNIKILDGYREKIDEMENPPAFFQSAAWQRPEQLAATAGFRLGWNNYYAGLLFAENNPQRKQLFTEAVEGFSRAFVDAKDDKVIITSIFGRGLCYRQMKLYKDALKDFQAVRQAIKKNDPLYLRCSYEEAQISFLRGEAQQALHRIAEIEKEYPENKIPVELKAALKDLKGSALSALAGKAAGKNETMPANSSEGPR